MPKNNKPKLTTIEIFSKCNEFQNLIWKEEKWQSSECHQSAFPGHSVYSLPNSSLTDIKGRSVYLDRPQEGTNKGDAKALSNT